MNNNPERPPEHQSGILSPKSIGINAVLAGAEEGDDGEFNTYTMNVLQLQQFLMTSFAALRQPSVVHMAMLRGQIGVPTMTECAHVHGEEYLARWKIAETTTLYADGQSLEDTVRHLLDNSRLTVRRDVPSIREDLILTFHGMERTIASLVSELKHSSS